MPEQDNIKLARSCYEAFGRGDIAALLGALADDVDWFHPGAPDVTTAGRFKGPAQVAEFFKNLDARLEFEQFETRQFVGDGDTVVVLGYEKAKVKATGKTQESEWAHVMTVRDGKVTTFREYIDTAKLAAAFR